MSAKRKCGGCGRPVLKSVRATIVGDGSPRVGRVCRVCAACGVLVVPVTLRILPERPRKIPRGEFTRSILDKRARPDVLVTAEIDATDDLD